MVSRPGWSRRGVSLLGCLFSLVILAVAIYYGIAFGRVYLRYMEMKDRLRTAIRFSVTQADSTILRGLRSDVKEIGLPEEAKRFRIERHKNPAVITIWTEYRERVDLPLVHRVLLLRPRIVMQQ